MPKVTLDDPFTAPNGLTLTPFHLIVLLFGCLSLAASNLPLPPEVRPLVTMWQRAMVLLVLALIGYSVVTTQFTKYKEGINRVTAEMKLKESFTKRSEMKDKEPNAWANESAHPSQFLTTRDGKPRLFPFPLGKAGGSKALKGELWWEAGNSAHVGHFNQRETPEARAALKEEMEDKEQVRLKTAKKAHKAYIDQRKKWNKRLSNLKLVSGIVVVRLINQKAAIVCLAMLIYYIFASELSDMLKPKEEDEEEKPKKRKTVPTGPGMAITYLYEPTKDGVKETGAIPVKAPSHRLMTSLSSRYAS